MNDKYLKRVLRFVRLSSNEVYVRKIYVGFLINGIYDIKLKCKF